MDVSEHVGNFIQEIKRRNHSQNTIEELKDKIKKLKT